MLSNEISRVSQTLSNIWQGSEYASAFTYWVKVFKNGSSKICGRQPLKYLK